ncbi:MAG: glycosyltransferase [Sedimentisphaerales bacterium]|nr:glycosyltransferase [Sedimentisphaerales bacterium]
MVKISITALIYKSTKFADWIYESVYEFTPFLRRNEAEFYFVANDPTEELLLHLRQKGYKHYINRNESLTEEQLFKMGYGKPEYIHRVYRGWNQAILHANGQIVVLVNSDNYFSPDWLENLLKYLTPEMVVCSKLVERKHPKHPIFPGAYHGEFGNHPDNFNKQAFLDFCDEKRITGIEAGGAFMPCIFYKDSAVKVGLYPEGNIAGQSFDDVINYGDQVFFERLRSIGIKHFTALDSLVYHLKEGEMDSPLEAQTTGEIAANDIFTDLGTIPAPKEFILQEGSLTTKKANIIYSKLCMPKTSSDGLYYLKFVLSNNNRQWDAEITNGYNEPFKEFTVVDPVTKENLLVTAKDIFDSLKRGYDFSAAQAEFRRTRANINRRPSVAFTIKYSSIIGGGTLNVLEYANWLSDLGVDVAIYSNDKPPEWMEIKGRFYCIEDTRERYSAITEPVVIIYSVLELQDLLYCCDTTNKMIYHLAQGIEDHHYCVSTYESLMAPKTIFEFLFSLPVGRIAVSPHIRDYFERNYNQKTFDIFNGINLDIFKPRPKESSGKKIKILSSGNPAHLLKGKDDIKRALCLVANNCPHLDFSLTIVCGEKLYEKENLFADIPGNVNCRIEYGLSQEQMQRAYCESDIYINSSWYEGFGLPSIEAMACGIPVVQADNRGLDGVAKDRFNCLLIEPNNPQRMAEAIEILISDNFLKDNLIKNGIETAKENSKENQYKMFVSQFEKILDCSFDTAERSRGRQNAGNAANDARRYDKPVFSVMVPTCNQAEFLPDALDSLINQTYDNWEAVVVNDGSTDETTEVLNRYAEKDPRIRIFHKDNGGVASALNEGLRHARGQWICWLSSDDLFEPDKLQIHLKAIRENPDTYFFHTDYYIMDSRSNCRMPAKSDMDTFIPLLELQVLKFFEINYFNGISVAVHRNVFETVGCFNEKYRNGQDFDMWLRISALYPSFFIDKRTCITRIHPAQGTNISIDKAVYDSPGIYDSAVACLEFLNSHEFSEIFPCLDLSVAEEAMFAIENVLKVIINPLSFVNRCGYGPALLGRLREWITQKASSEIKLIIKSQIGQAIRNISALFKSEEINKAFELIYESLDKPFQYRQYDPLSEMELNAQRLESAGQTEQTRIARDYLAQVSQKREKKIAVKDGPLFSIVVPTYNQAEFLPQSLDSLINQTCGNWEAVVVNDGSTDGTAEVLNRYAAKDSRIRVINKTNGGVASALNEGVKAARGKWICWLSSDDMFEPDKLEVHLQTIRENPDIRFFHTNYYLFDDEKEVKCELKSDHREIVAPAELQVLKFFETNYVNGISIAVHREVFDKVGYFDEKYRCGQDFDMWLRISACYRSFFIDRKTCVTRWHQKQGMRSFPEAGSFDSCRACVEFLNSHEYGDCFPLIDLTTAGGAAKAIKETMAVVFNINAMMYRCCFNTALLDRLCEWLSQRCPGEIKEALMPHLRSMLDNLNNSSLPEEVKAALLTFSENLSGDFRYSHHDFEKQTAQYVQRLSAAGQSERTANIERYLSLLKNPDEIKNHPGERSGSLVSVIMPALNASKYIQKAIESVLEQDYDNFEFVIVDDGSTDNTREIIAGFDDKRIKYFYKDCGGAASARNLAVQKSEGSLISVLDANDMMKPGLISAHLREFENCPDADLVYCDDCLIDKDGGQIRVIKCPEYPDDKSLIRDLFRSGFPIVPFRTCIKRSVFDKIGYYDENLSAGWDYDMMRRFVKQGLKIHHLPNALYMRRMLLENNTEEMAAQRAKSLFDILGRFVDTFAYDELFPDVAWEKINPQKREFFTKYLVAATYLSIGSAHLKTNSPPVYNRMACELAEGELKQCLQSEPDNENIRQLLKKCRMQRQNSRQKAHRTAILAGEGKI